MQAIMLTLLVGVAGWLIASKLGLSAPAMLGSMLAVGITNALFGYAELPQAARILAQSISGAFIAVSIHASDIPKMRRLLVPTLLLMAMFTVNTLVVGLALHRLFGIELYTALLSSVAGGIADISMIAMDFEQCDASTVAFLQTMRLVSVLLFFPAWIRLLTRNIEGAEVEEQADDIADEPRGALARILTTPARQFAMTLAVCLGFGIMGKLSGIPAGTMMFAIIGTTVVNLSSGCCRMPRAAKRMAQLLAGSLVGTTITSETVASLAGMLGPLLVLLASYWLVNLIYALLSHRLGMLDLKSAMFAAAPGGASDMALIAADLDADLAKIATIQLLRSVYAAALMPLVVVLFANLIS